MFCFWISGRGQVFVDVLHALTISCNLAIVLYLLAMVWIDKRLKLLNHNITTIIKYFCLNWIQRHSLKFSSSVHTHACRLKKSQPPQPSFSKKLLLKFHLKLSWIAVKLNELCIPTASITCHQFIIETYLSVLCWQYEMMHRWIMLKSLFRIVKPYQRSILLYIPVTVSIYRYMRPWQY